MSEDSSRIPKYTQDLLEELNLSVPKVSIDNYSGKDWERLNNSKVRHLAFLGGMRALVDELLEWQRESTDVGNEDGESVDLHATILDPSGEAHRGVAPVQLARSNPRQG